MKKVRIGIIGNGIIGEHHLNLYSKIPEAEIVCLCDINEARMNEMGDKFGVARRTANIGEMLRMDDIEKLTKSQVLPVKLGEDGQFVPV